MHTDPTNLQIMTAVLGIAQLEKLDEKESTKILMAHCRKLHGDAKATWKYVLEESDANGSALNKVRNGFFHDRIVTDGPWKKLLSPELNQKIKTVDESYKPTSEREKWLYAMGDRHFVANSDGFPKGKPIGINTGIGCLVLDTHGNMYRLERKQKEVKIELDISSWRGISIGAEHYYAKLKCFYFAPNMVPLAPIPEDQRWQGSLSDRLKPRILQVRDITIRRPLTKSDIKTAKSLGHDDRYECYKIGDMIDGFWEKDHAIEYATKTFNQLFDNKSFTLVNEER